MAKKTTTDDVSSIASRGLKDPGSLSKKEIKIISASALGQDERTKPTKPTSPSASKPAPEKAAKKAAAAKKKP